MASRALTVRFMTTCSICPGSAETRPVPASSRSSSWTSSPMSRRSIVARLPTSVLTSITCGWRNCRRLKARSWRVRLAARSDARRICSTSWASASPFLRTLRIRSLWPMMTARRLLKSWAIAAGQAADGLHLLRLPELGLEALPLGGVLQDRQRPDRRAGRVPEEREREAALHPAPVAGQDLGLVLPDAVLHAEAPHQGPRRVPSAPLELGDRPAQHLVGAVAEELLGPRAPVRDAALHVGGHDSRGRVLRDGAEEVAGAARLLVEPGVADRPRGLADEALEELPVLGVEVERRPPVQREDAEQRVLMDDRHDVRAPEVVLPEPLHGEDAPVREDVRDDQGLAVRGDPAGQPLLELDAAARVRGGELARRRTPAGRASAPPRRPPRARRPAPPSARPPRARSR